MKIKIYQIDRDKDNGSLSFLNYENTVKRTGGRIRSEIYHKVLTAMLSAADLKMFILCSTKTVPSHLPVTLFRCRILWRLRTPMPLKKGFTSVIASASKKLILSVFFAGSRH